MVSRWNVRCLSDSSTDIYEIRTPHDIRSIHAIYLIVFLFAAGGRIAVVIPGCCINDRSALLKYNSFRVQVIRTLVPPRDEQSSEIPRDRSILPRSGETRSAPARIFTQQRALPTIRPMSRLSHGFDFPKRLRVPPGKRRSVER
ncbi:hypothetical protein KM043_006523 [Ampulex compressa]|nr:hypothetical protein KM043_006523 [Ampulex compressa]